jgi:F5/8 type C domain/Glycosyl hydrolases family 43
MVALLAARCGSNDAGTIDAAGSPGAAGSRGTAGMTGRAGASGGGAAGVNGFGGTITGTGGAAAGTTGRAGRGGTAGTTGTTGAAGSSATGGASAIGGVGGAAGVGGSATTGGTGGFGGAAGGAGTGGAASSGWVTIHNDFFWYDQDGNLINVRSGALRKFGDLYYWYGSAPDDRNQNCYSSPDLVHWTFRGIVLKTTGGANRMDILYDATTKQYVIFLKYIGNGAHFGIATGSAPDGQFTFESETLVDGALIGDMSMYQDDDGQAYLAYVWWGTGTNREHGIYRMSADYLTLDTRIYLWNVPSREAPHIFKRNGIYYYGTSRTAGINPTATTYNTATALAGPWSAATTLNTPGSTTSYETQCDFVFPFVGTQGIAYMYDGDRWLPTGGSQGDYVWLPMTFDAAGVPTMTYYQDWDLNIVAGTWRPFDRARDLALGKTATASSQTGANVAAGVTTATTYQNYTATRWESAATDPQWIMVDLGTSQEVDRVILKWYSDCGKAFKIQASTDGTNWTNVYSTTTGASYSVTDVTFAKTTARYVRMNGTQRGNQNGYSLFAFMVLDD